MKIDLLGGNYKQTKADLNPQQTINWYLKYATQQEKAKSPQVLWPTPGLEEYIDTGGTQCRGLFTNEDVFLAVVDNVLYDLSVPGVATSRGTLSAWDTVSRKVYMKENLNDELFIADGPSGYIYNIRTQVFSQITDVDFPGADTVTYLDGYFVITYQGTAYYSNLGDGTSWTATDFINPTYIADSSL